MAEIDKDVLETLNEEQVELGVSDEKQIRRCELNFYAELISQLKEMNHRLDDMHNTLNMVGADKLTAYFKEFTDNFAKEERRARVKAKISKSHQTPRS